MDFTPEETQKLKTMFTFIVKKKHLQSDGKSGFVLKHLEPILEQLEEDGIIINRPTINSNAYFLTIK